MSKSQAGKCLFFIPDPIDLISNSEEERQFKTKINLRQSRKTKRMPRGKIVFVDRENGKIIRP
jgi:hypothetical protein